MPEITHTRLAATATRLIAKHGRSITIESKPWTGPELDPAGASVLTVASGVQTTHEKTHFDGDLIVSGDLFFLIDGEQSVEPGMVLIDGAVNYSIKNVVDITPGETPIILTVKVRI